ncbi:MAG: phage tail length tape measure family protein [Thermodesulfobacteriota bacterium]|nr:phage tail length tape measure family protein [Thermodesulfobacteriota bacterium]
MAKDVKFDIRGQDKSAAAFNSVKRNLSGITKSLGGLKTMAVGMAAGVAGIYALGKGIETVTQAAMTQRDAEAKLGAVLQSTGHAAGFTLDQLKNMAAGLQQVTTFGDETVLSGMAILATFKNIRGEGFERTAKAALDMSTVMGTDLKSSMVMLGKALNDPIANLSALSRSGVQFNVQQKEMIKDLVESGDLMTAQGIILQELESQFGGAAEAAGGPFNKALGQLKNAWGDLLEEIGFAIVDNEAFMAILDEVKNIIQEMIPYVGDLVDDFAAWIGPADQLRAKLDMFLATVNAMIWPLKQLWKLMNLVGKGIGTGAAMAYTAGEKVLGYQTGTGPAGLPSDGLFYGHKKEIVLNQAESEAMRSGAGGGEKHYHFHLETLAADPTTLRNAAQIFKREMDALDHRWGEA